MPTYQYVCTECGEQIEVVQKFTDDPLTVHETDGARLRKVFSPVGIVFKGSGFYRTDSRKGGVTNSSSSSDGSSSDSPSSSSADKPAKSDAAGGDKSGGDKSGSDKSSGDKSGGSKPDGGKSGGDKSGGSSSAAKPAGSGEKVA